VTSSEPIPVVIFCGGYGKRMGGELQTKKELVEIGGRAILWHIMRIFAAYGHTHFILPLGQRASDIKRYFMELKLATQDLTLTLGSRDEIAFHTPAEEEGWRITLADTGLTTHKGSRIYLVARHLGDAKCFFVTYGDGVGDVDIDALLAFHRSHGKLVTITGVHPRSQYGLINVDGQSRVTGFEQKPRLEHWINGGFMVFQRETLDYLGRGHDVHLERTLLPELAAKGELMMYPHVGFWRSMDTFNEALELDAIWRERAPWKVW
jgi:glucose-1-phosphate cytidylyltransferase